MRAFNLAKLRQAVPFDGRGFTRWTIYALMLLLAAPSTSAVSDSSEGSHEPGTCSMYGICGHRKDGDVLNCATPEPSQPLSPSGQQKLQAVCPQLAKEVGLGSGFCCTEEQLDRLQAQIQIASIFLVGCPACNHNFKHFFCLLTCSPDQATFSNVTATQQASDTNATAVAEVDYYVTSAFGRAFFDSCKDVVYPVLNQKAMTYVGGGAKNYQEWFEFLGEVKDKREPPTGSPFQMNFPPEEAGVPEGLRLMNDSLPSCGDPALACSCGDCPAAPGCEPPPPPPPPAPGGCPALHTSSLSCIDISLLAVYAGLLALLPLFLRSTVSQLRYSRGEVDGYEWLHSAPSAALPELRGEGADALRRAASLPVRPPSWNKDRSRPALEHVEDVEEEFIEYSAAEQAMRRWLYQQGLLCARRPVLVLTLCLLCVGACALGMVRLRVMTDPQELWVGRGSQAAQEKADYEASFGPFYRITQLILTTTPKSDSSYITPSGLPSIVTDANLRLLFDMQDQIDGLTAVIEGPPVEVEDSSSGAENLEHNRRSFRSDGSASSAAGQLAAPSKQRTDHSQSHRGAASKQGGREGAEEAEVQLGDVCLKPMGDSCATQSVLQYWKMSRDVYDKGEPPLYAHLTPDFCFSHWSTQCRAAFGAPIDPHLVLGGFPTDSSQFRNYTADATAFVVTFPLDSHPDKREAALAWEFAFVELASTRLTSMAAAANLTLSFSTERSVEDELQRESTADISTVLLSYLAMLLYIAVALGTFPRRPTWQECLVHSRAGLGLGGVLVVAASVAGALGLCGWLGMKATLIIMEVIPFLVLAVGVDNMFILAHALADSPEPRAPLPHRVGLALAAVGPSITLAAACEVVAFAMGAMTSMPALRNFSVCAAVAVALDYVLQVTAFTALLALDTYRVESGRYDCLPWRRSTQQPLYGSEYDEELLPAGEEVEGGEEVVALGPGFAMRRGSDERVGVWRALRWYMSEVHAPLLLRPLSKAVVLAVFVGMFLLSCALVPRLERGLDQSVALPRDSYLQPYYHDVMSSLRVGPPAMLVVRGLNLSEAAPDVEEVCSVAGCRQDSLLNQVSQASRAPWSSWLATPAASWLDDFLTWVSPEIPQCCRQFANGTRCPPPDQPPCSLDPLACQECAACFTGEDLPGGHPSLEQFQARLPWFLASKPSQACAKGGAGAYSDAIQMDSADPGGVAGLRLGLVNASAFRTNYVVLSKQSDFIDAMQAMRDLASRLGDQLGLDVYSYSIFHIFFEQYLTIVGEALVLLGSAAVAVFLICLAATGSPWAASMILLVLGMLLVDLLGAMYLWGIQLNAVSLVNLVMGLGIGVEFCAHIIHAFMEEEGSPDARAAAALGDVGAAVLSGITLTKFVGVSVLAFAHTRIFEVYYFRMYMALVVLGAAHGLILLPVLLSSFGPDAFDHWQLRKQRRGTSEGRGQPRLEELVDQAARSPRGAPGQQQGGLQAPPQQQQLGDGWAIGRQQGIAGQGASSGAVELEG